MISWLFEIDTLRLSTKDVTWNAIGYSGVILADSFSGITMRWNIAGNGLIAPNEMSFDVSNTEATYTTSQFEEKFCTVRLIEDDSNTRTWKFKIKRAIAYYGKITCYCVDFLQEHLVGDYPNTKAPKEVWSSDDAESSDDYCIPVVLGVAYIPVRSVNTASERFYVLGESGPTYTVHEVASPRQWPNRSIWSAASYNMNGYVNSGYQLLQPIIADSTGDGNADATGLWRSGDTFYDMLCRFERNDTAALNNPAEWVEYVLKDFGIDPGDIDAVSFADAASTYDTLTVGFDGGGWWKKEPRERILSNLLSQTDSFIKCTDKVELYQFDKTPQETITNVLLLSFSPSKVTKVNNDSGRVHWPEAFDKPSDILNGKAVVPTHGGGTENTPSSEILECRFLSGQSINAQKAGILYFQKKYEQSQRINFSVTFSSLTKKATLTPGQVVTVDNSLYGGTNNVIITDMTILPDMRVNFTGVVLNHLEDWGDLTTTTKDVITDTSMGFQLATTDYSGNVSSDWDLLLNIPQRFLDTATLGINVTDSYMGYYDGTNFTVYIDANGNMRAGDPDLGQGFVWNQSAGAYTISGSLTVQNPAGVRSNLNVADGADVTQVALDLGAAIDNAKANGNTLISGGFIRTSLINASAIVIGDLSGAGSLASQDQTDLSLTPSDNQIPNPDFELGLGGWVIYNTENPLETSSKVILHARTDTPYGKLLLRATGAVNFETQKYIPVSEGKTYFGEIWARPASFDSVDTNIRFYAGVRQYDYDKVFITNNYFIASNVTITSYFGWRRYTGTFAVPTGTSYIRAMGLLNYQGTADDGILDVGYMRISEVEAGADVTATSTFVQATYPNDKTALQNDIDSKIISWFTSSDPSASWSGTNTSHAGDMWWNTSTNKLKRYSGTAWSAELTDQKAIDAYANAATAQDTADEKRRVFTATPTPPYDIGDLWDRGSTLGIWRANTAATTTYSLTHWQAVADRTANNTANDTSNVNGLPSTNVSGWAHPTDRTTIHGGKIYTGSITAQQIAAGTITAAEIAAGSITAESGVVGSLDADKITTGTLSAGSVKVSSNDGKTYFLGDTFFVYDASNQLRVKIGRLS